jgi:hypothetical protein
MNSPVSKTKKYATMLKYGVPERGVQECAVVDGVVSVDRAESFVKGLRVPRQALALSEIAQKEHDAYYSREERANDEQDDANTVTVLDGDKYKDGGENDAINPKESSGLIASLGRRVWRLLSTGRLRG